MILQTRNNTSPWLILKSSYQTNQGLPCPSRKFVGSFPIFDMVLLFKIFTGHGNLFASAKYLKSSELQMNSALNRVKEWCDIKKSFDKSKEHQLHDSKISKEKEYECKY